MRVAGCYHEDPRACRCAVQEELAQLRSDLAQEKARTAALAQLVKALREEVSARGNVATLYGIPVEHYRPFLDALQLGGLTPALVLAAHAGAVGQAERALFAAAEFRRQRDEAEAVCRLAVRVKEAHFDDPGDAVRWGEVVDSWESARRKS